MADVDGSHCVQKKKSRAWLRLGQHQFVHVASRHNCQGRPFNDPHLVGACSALCCHCVQQVRSLQRMASNVFVRGMSNSFCGSMRGMGSRQNSSSGGYLALGAHSRAASRLAAHPIGDISESGTGPSDGLFTDEHDVLGGDLSPVTPARPSGMCGGDLLGEPLMVSMQCVMRTRCKCFCAVVAAAQPPLHAAMCTSQFVAKQGTTWAGSKCSKGRQAVRGHLT